MIANIGFGVLTVSFLTTLYSVFAAIYGERTKNPTTVESARRALTRRNSGVCPLGAQVVLVLLKNEKPTSSTKAICAPSWRAFFECAASRL